jgi:hypothetical protein
VTEVDVLSKILTLLEDLAKKVGGSIGSTTTPKGAVQSAISGITPKTLSSDEERLERDKTRIFAKTLGIERDHFIKDRKFKETYFEKLENSFKKVAREVMPPSDSSKGGNKPKGPSIFQNMIGFAAFAAGVYIIVSAMTMASDIKFDGVVKATLAIGLFVLAFLQFGKMKSDLKNASISFALFSATLLFLVLPLLYGFAAMPIGKFLGALVKLSIIFAGLILIARQMSQLKQNDLRNSAVSFAIFAATIGFIIIPMIALLGKLSWDKVFSSLGKLSAIIATIGVIVYEMKRLGPDTVIKSSAGIALFGLTFSLIILPLLESIYEVPWTQLLASLFKMGLVLGAIVGMIYLIGKIPKGQLMEGAVTVGLIGIVLFGLSFALSRYANMEWSKIISGLLASTVAVGIFGLALAGIGAILFTNPEVALFLAIGGVVIMALTGLLIMLALGMMAFGGDYNWAKIGANIFKALGIVTLFGAAVIVTGLVLAAAAIPIAAALLVVGPLLIFLGILALGMKAFGGDYDWDLIAENIDNALGVVRGFTWGLIKTSLALALLAIPLAIAVATIGPLMIFLKLLSVTMEIFSGDYDWDTISKNIITAMGVIDGFTDSLVTFASKYLFKTPLILAALIQVSMLASLMSSIASAMEDFSQGINWENVRINVAESQLALNDFMGVISNITQNFSGKMKDLSVADPLISKILALMEKVADSLSLFSDIDGENIFKVGMGLSSLGMGVATYVMALTRLKDFDEKRLAKLVAGISYFSILDGDNLTLVGFGISSIGLGLSSFFNALGNKGNSIINLFKETFLVDMIKKFETLDGDKLYDSGQGIYNLGGGLYWFLKYLMISSIKNIGNAFVVFGVLKMFQSLEGEKLADIGDGLKYLSEGLIALSSDEINFDNLLAQIKSIAIPLAGFSFVLDKFTKVYSAFGKVAQELGLDKQIKMSFEDQTGIQKALLDLQQQELEIQRDQLDQLVENGRLLGIIANKVGGQGGAIAGGGNEDQLNITSPTFKTKSNYISAMNSAANSFEGAPA